MTVTVFNLIVCPVCDEYRRVLVTYEGRVMCLRCRQRQQYAKQLVEANFS